MKSKKSIFVVALAALMLIAFTACEQPVYKVPTGLSVTSTRTAYLAGESIDMSTITGTLEYSDGSTRSVSGSELSVLSAGNGKFEFGYSNLKATLEFTEYAVTDITSLAISGLPTTVVKDSTTVDVKGVATLPNGETSNVDVELTITGVGTVGASVEPTISTYTIAIGEGVAISKDKVTGIDDWKVTVVTGEDFDATKITSIKVEQTNPNADGKQWVLDTVSYKVIATDVNGTTKELTTSEYTWKDGKAPASSYQLKKAAATEKYVAVLNSNPSITSNEFNYSAGTPWITNISVAKSETSTEETTIAGGATYTVSTYYKFNVEWAGGKEQSGTEWTYTEGTNGVLFNPTVPTYGTDAGEATTYTASFSLQYGKDDAWHAKTAPSYNITEA